MNRLIMTVLLFCVVCLTIVKLATYYYHQHAYEVTNWVYGIDSHLVTCRIKEYGILVPIPILEDVYYYSSPDQSNKDVKLACKNGVYKIDGYVEMRKVPSNHVRTFRDFHKEDFQDYFM